MSMKKFMVITALAACMALCGCAETNGLKRPDGSPKEDVSERFLCDSSGYSFETVTDTKTGVVYLIWQYGTGNNAVGGITVLVHEDGTPVTSEEVNNHE